MTFEDVAGWASIISLLLSIYSIYLIGSIRSNIVSKRRRLRLVGLLSGILTIPDDAIPLGKASEIKFDSLLVNIPSGYPFFWMAKNRSIIRLRKSLRAKEIAKVKECIEDYKSHYSEDL